MPSINDFSPSERIFALFISRSGDGKSAAAASFPRPYLQLDYDGRFDGVFGATTLNGGWLPPENIEYKRIFPKDGYSTTNKFLEEMDLYLTSRSEFPYKTIEIASLTNFLRAAVIESHKLTSGRMVGKLRMSGPDDYRFEISALMQLVDYFQKFPCHVIFSAHVIDKWGKPKTGKKGEEYASNEITGEKLLMRDQVGENIQTFFSNIFRFSRELDNQENMKYYVEFNTDIAKNSFNVPPGRFDITRKNFYNFLQETIKKVKEGKPLFSEAEKGVFNL